MAFRDINVEEYVRSLFERQPSATDESVAANASSGVPIEDEGEPVIRPLSQASEGLRQAMATRAPLAATVAPRALPELSAEEPVVPPSYLEALSAAQDRDRMASGFAGGLAGAEQAAQILSRGLYRPMGLAPTPSAVSELEQRQKAVQEMLAAKRGERAESRQAQAFEQEAELNTVQIARQNALMEAEKLRLAMEQGEAPYKVLELQANVRKALAQAQLAEETAKAKGRPVVVVARPPKEPKAPPAPAEKPRQLPPTIIEELSGFDPALKTLKNLTDYYKSLQLSGFFSRTAAKLGESAPEKVLLYEAAAAPVRQAVGVILEKGKLAEGDISRYKQMMPKPGDSEAVVDKKLETLTSVLNDIRASKVKELRGAGFQVGEQAPQTPAQPTAPQSEKEARQDRQADFARKAVAEFKRAQEVGAAPEVLERLRNEAQAAIKAAGG